MKLQTTEPDLATLYARIQRGDLDLQPGFQRQEVWPELKKKRLIDTILRGWHVPPIHVVEVSEGKQEVLDGQQRLVAIRDFMGGGLQIDGTIDPPSGDVRSLHGLRYSELPERIRRRFDTYPVRVVILSEYGAGEPGELFFRLNQQTTLTAPEQRNAFFGPARDQVRALVQESESEGLNQSLIGFGNSRMAYDDIVARFCEAVEAGTLLKKITANAVTDRYRSRSSYSEATIRRARGALGLLVSVLHETERSTALNKATAHSWLCFFAALRHYTDGVGSFPVDVLGRFVRSFERSRAAVRHSRVVAELLLDWAGVTSEISVGALRLYNDVASSRVADVSSVLLRDYVTWFLFWQHDGRSAGEVMLKPHRRRALEQGGSLLAEDRLRGEQASGSLASSLESLGWGPLF